MSSFVSEDEVRQVFHNLDIIRISRVDFTPIGKKPGFAKEKENNFNMKSAFIHFSHFNNDPVSLTILEEIAKDKGGYRVFPVSLCANWPTEKCAEYWLLLKAEAPIQETMMNNAQIVENCRFLEKIIEDQSDNILLLEQTVSDQAHTIQQLEKKLENVQDTVYQLLGGLFCGTTQAGTLNTRIGYLFGDKQYEKKNNTSKWGNNPTTCQGDSNERRIDALEAQMAAAGELLYDMTKKEIEVYEPTRSQFCDFKYYEEDDDEDTLVTSTSRTTDYDSMPELEPIYNSDSSIEKRRINSFQLCGNE